MAEDIPADALALLASTVAEDAHGRVVQTLIPIDGRSDDMGCVDGTDMLGIARPAAGEIRTIEPQDSEPMVLDADTNNTHAEPVTNTDTSATAPLQGGGQESAAGKKPLSYADAAGPKGDNTATVPSARVSKRLLTLRAPKLLQEQTEEEEEGHMHRLADLQCEEIVIRITDRTIMASLPPDMAADDLGEWACQVLMGGSDKYLYDELGGEDKSAADALDQARKTAHLLAINALESSSTSVALLIKGPQSTARMLRRVITRMHHVLSLRAIMAANSEPTVPKRISVTGPSINHHILTAEVALALFSTITGRRGILNPAARDPITFNTGRRQGEIVLVFEALLPYGYNLQPRQRPYGIPLLVKHAGQDRCARCNSTEHTKDCPLPFCYTCHTTSHSTRDCEEARNQRQHLHATDSICHACHKFGHLQRACPTRQAKPAPQPATTPGDQGRTSPTSAATEERIVDGISGGLEDEPWVPVLPKQSNRKRRGQRSPVTHDGAQASRKQQRPRTTSQPGAKVGREHRQPPTSGSSRARLGIQPTDGAAAAATTRVSKTTPSRPLSAPPSPESGATTMTAPLPSRPTSPPTEALRSKRAAPQVARQRNIKKAVSPGPAATTHRAVETGSIPMEGKRSRQPTGKMSHGTPPNTAFLPILSGDRTPTPASPNPAWEEPHVPEEALTEQMHVLEIAAAPGQATSQPPLVRCRRVYPGKMLPMTAEPGSSGGMTRHRSKRTEMSGQL